MPVTCDRCRVKKSSPHHHRWAPRDEKDHAPPDCPRSQRPTLQPAPPPLIASYGWSLAAHWQRRGAARRWCRATISGSLRWLNVRFGLLPQEALCVQFDAPAQAGTYRGRLHDCKAAGGRAARRTRRPYARYAAPGTELRAGSSGLRLSQRPNTSSLTASAELAGACRSETAAQSGHCTAATPGVTLAPLLAGPPPRLSNPGTEHNPCPSLHCDPSVKGAQTWQNWGARERERQQRRRGAAPHVLT